MKNLMIWLPSIEEISLDLMHHSDESCVLLPCENSSLLYNHLSLKGGSDTF